MTNIGAHAYADVEGGLKTWLSSHAVIAPLVGATGSPLKNARVFLGMPSGGVRAWPTLVVFRIGGGPLSAVDYPADFANVQIDCWGNIGDKVGCFLLTQTVVRTLLDLSCGTLMSSAVRVLGVSSVTVPYIPDRDNGRPRYSVSAVIQVQAV